MCCEFCVALRANLRSLMQDTNTRTEMRGLQCFLVTIAIIVTSGARQDPLTITKFVNQPDVP